MNFRYEKLHTFCFNYGNVGHNEEFCLKENTKLNYPKGKNPFGRWLRSFEYGKRIKDPNDRAYSNNLMNSPSYRDFSPIPEVVLKKLGKLHITDNQQGKTEDMQGSSSKVKHSEVKDNNFQQGQRPKQPLKRICLTDNSKISSKPTIGLLIEVGWDLWRSSAGTYVGWDTLDLLEPWKFWSSITIMIFSLYLKLSCSYKILKPFGIIFNST